jgi:hypothetical protein
MNRNYKILTGLAAAGIATYLIRRYRGSKQTSMSSASTSSRPQKHMTDVFSNAKNMGTNAMA